MYGTGNTIVETYATGADLRTLVLGAYSDGRERKHFHGDAKLAARDFGERVAMLSRDGLVTSRMEFEEGSVTFRAEYENGVTVQVMMY